MKRLGQHFLKNKSAIRSIVDGLELAPNDFVIEIGAGHGELTSELRSMNHELRIIAIEKDAELANLLREKFARDKNMEIIEGDVLKIIPSIIHNSLFMLHTYKLVGNIPYYITGKLLRLISEFERKPSRCVFAVQKEVAERICAQPRGMNPVRGRPAEGAATTALGRSASNGMNRLAASIQFWAIPEIVRYISRNDFEPAPEVDSAIIVLASRVRGQGSSNITPERYYRTVRILFQQPRKTILNNLIGNDKEIPKNLITERLQKIGIAPGDRPQNLSVGDIIKIADILDIWG